MTRSKPELHNLPSKHENLKTDVIKESFSEENLNENADKNIE